MKKKKTKDSPHAALIESFLKYDEKELLTKLEEFKDHPLKFEEKDNLEYWIDLLNKFDNTYTTLRTQFEETKEDKYVSVAELKDSNIRNTLLLHLRFTKVLLENTYNKHVFNSEPLCSFLNVDDLELTKEILEVLATLVKKPHPHSRRGYTEVYLDYSTLEKLFCLAQGWGSKEAGFGILSCLDEKFSKPIPVHFEYYIEANDSTNTYKNKDVDPQPTPGIHVIHLPDVHLYKESSCQSVTQLINAFSIPEKYHFPLFARIRLAKLFPDPTLRRQYIYLRLLAFAILAQTHNSEPNYTAAFFRGEPDFLTELVDLMQTEQSIPQVQLHFWMIINQ